MGFFDRFKKKKNPDSKAFRWEMANSINRRHIRYVTEKRNGVDEVIGRSGNLNIKGEDLLLYASSDVIFRARIDELQIWELLSKDGVVLTGKDLEHGGVERTVIAYYVYYRK